MHTYKEHDCKILTELALYHDFLLRFLHFILLRAKLIIVKFHDLDDTTQVFYDRGAVMLRTILKSPHKAYICIYFSFNPCIYG